MCDIIALDEQQPHIAVIDGFTDTIQIICVSDIRRLANGQSSIAEYQDAEGIARALAIALIERL